jgi:hypothetical protein
MKHIKNSISFSALTVIPLTFALLACESNFKSGQGNKETPAKKAPLPTDPKKGPNEGENNGKGDKGSPNPELDPKPNPDPKNPVPTKPPPVKCEPQTKRKPIRIVFVVDNSGSNGRKDGASPAKNETHLTDPVKLGATPFDSNGRYTYRQKALFELIQEAQKLDREALVENSQFPGTEVGVVSFPLSNAEPTRYQIQSQQMGFAKPMINLKNMPFNSASTRQLWDAFNFTHFPQGMTPYKVGLEGAKELFRAKDVTLAKEDHIIFISDGLPTDERPSTVRAVRAALSFAHFHLLNFRVLSNGQDTSESTHYDGLKEMFFGTAMWARKPGNNDGYSGDLNGYSRYWFDLKGLPNELSQSQATVSVEDLKKTLSGLMSQIQSCQGVIKQEVEQR